LAAAGNFRLGLLLLRARAAAIHVGGHDLVNQRFVVIDAEHGVVDRHLGATVVELDFHGYRSYFTVGRTMTSPPAWPGTAPLTSSRFLSASMRTRSRFSAVTR